MRPELRRVTREYRDAIEMGLSQGRNGKAIWQDLVDAHGFPGSYQGVKRFVRKLQASDHQWRAGSNSSIGLPSGSSS